jgi:hypothetical protein
MKSRTLLAVCAFAALAAVTPARADEIGDTLQQVEAVTYGAVTDGQAALDGAAVVGTPPTPSTVRVLDYYTDAIAITDYGTGAVMSKGGVFSNAAWWTCAKTNSAGGSVLVTCTANPNSGITWQCGIMHLHAMVWSRPVDRYDWAQETLRSVDHGRAAPSVPNPRGGRWGRVAGRVSCGSATLTTAQADQNNTYVAAQAQMGPVTTIVCEARLTPTSDAAPVAPYTVNCVDPANPKDAVS